MRTVSGEASAISRRAASCSGLLADMAIPPDADENTERTEDATATATENRLFPPPEGALQRLGRLRGYSQSPGGRRPVERTQK
jgi:hypothetical protein